MKNEQTDAERAATLDADKDIRRQRNPLKDNRRTPGSQKAVVNNKQIYRTPNGPCRDKEPR